MAAPRGVVPPHVRGSLSFGPPGLDRLIGEAIALFHRMSSLSTQLHGGGSTSAGRRSVLLQLDREGPRTVPEMARARPVSRQYMQTLVNALALDGQVELVENPRHKRSRLVRLTARGRRRLRSIEKRELEFASQIRVPTSASELERAADTLEEVRHFFEKLASGHRSRRRHRA